MAPTTIGFGIALILVGLVGFLATGATHVTALIPAAAGILLAGLGLVARNPKARMHAMHGAALVGLVGFLGSVGGIVALVRAALGHPLDRPGAAIARTAMSLLCLAFVALTVRSFARVRIARRREALQNNRPSEA